MAPKTLPFTVVRVTPRAHEARRPDGTLFDQSHLEIILRPHNQLDTAQRIWDDDSLDLLALPEVAKHLDPAHGLYECAAVEERTNRSGIRYLRLCIVGHE